MAWAKDGASCSRPLGWFLRDAGSEWTCPDCGKLWRVMPNPDTSIGGRVFWPVVVCRAPSKDPEAFICRV